MEKLLELARRKDPKFLDWLKSKGLRTGDRQIEIAIAVFERGITNWKEGIPFREHSKEVLNFRKFLESEIISEYERTIGSIALAI